MLFEFLAYLTGLVLLIFTLLAWLRYRDPFHPMIYMAPMLMFLYSFLPLYLTLTQWGDLRGFLSEDDLIYVQTINALGAFSICAGILAASGPASAWYAIRASAWLPPMTRQRLAHAALLLGALGVASYLYQVFNVGGFGAAYGRAYGGGSAESGHVREAMLLTVPGLLLLMTARINRPRSQGDWVLYFLFSAPLLIHGLLGGRRGPTFLIVVALCAGWCFMRFRRPRLSTSLLGGVCLGILLLFLVANRDQIYLRSDLQFDTGFSSYVFEADSSNEFIAGAGWILKADSNGERWWGRRYAVILFVRPIPRFIWPSKYADASSILGAPNLEESWVQDYGEIRHWTIAVGSSPTIVPEMWAEFWVLSFPVLFLIGWSYGRTWLNAVGRRGIWITMYCLMFSLAIYLVMQALEAMLFRFLLLAVPAWLAWRYAGGAAATGQLAVTRWRSAIQ